MGASDRAFFNGPSHGKNRGYATLLALLREGRNYDPRQGGMRNFFVDSRDEKRPPEGGSVLDT